MSDSNDQTAFNRRSFTRVPVRMRATISSEKGNFSCETSDISFRGFLLETHETLPVGSHVRAVLTPPTGDGELQLQLAARVVDNRPNGVACEITTIHEPASFDHLRRFILFNAENPDQVLDEIKEHLGLNDHKEAS